MKFSKSTPAVLATLFSGFALTGSALACSTDGWDATSGAVVVGSPFGATPPDLNNIWRFEESCALQATGAGPGHVQTNSASHSAVTNRFYFLSALAGGGGPDGASEAEILVGYSAENGTGELFSVGLEGGNIRFTTQGGGTMTVPAPGGWTLVEYHWDSVADTFDFWVNADATTDPPTGSINGGAGPATLESVRLGLPEGLGPFGGGTVNFDSFEMHNTTAIGRLIHCDADGDTMVNVNDAVAVVDEVFAIALAAGVPDCNLSGGALDVNDAVAIVDVIFGG